MTHATFEVRDGCFSYPHGRHSKEEERGGGVDDGNHLTYGALDRL